MWHLSKVTVIQGTRDNTDDDDDSDDDVDAIPSGARASKADLGLQLASTRISYHDHESYQHATCRP